ncbi:unnamed protein product, partial [Prunus brigantina]
GSKQLWLGFNEKVILTGRINSNRVIPSAEADGTASSGRGRAAGKTYKEAVESENGPERTVTENNTTVGKSNWSWVVTCERQAFVCESKAEAMRVSSTGSESYFVKIRPLSPVIRPINSRFPPPKMVGSRKPVEPSDSDGLFNPGDIFSPHVEGERGNHIEKRNFEGTEKDICSLAAKTLECGSGICGIGRLSGSQAPQLEPTTEFRQFPEDLVRRSTKLDVKKSCAWAIKSGPKIGLVCKTIYEPNPTIHPLSNSGPGGNSDPIPNLQGNGSWVGPAQHVTRFRSKFSSLSGRRILSGRRCVSFTQDVRLGHGGEFATVAEVRQGDESCDSVDGRSITSVGTEEDDLPSKVEETIDVIECDDGSVTGISELQQKKEEGQVKLMKIKSWNVRGLWSKRKRVVVKEQLLRVNPDIVILQETKKEVFDRRLAAGVWGSRFKEWVYAPSRGRSGGIVNWNKEVFGDLVFAKKEAEARIAALDLMEGQGRLDNILRKEREDLYLPVSDLVHKEEVKWRQRGKIQWARDGDSNTKFFHRIASGRRKRNFIQKLEVEGSGVVVSEGEIELEIINFVKNLYSSNAEVGWCLEGLTWSAISVEEAEWLERPFEEEFKRAVFDCGTDKLPGPDGFSMLLFQSCWDIVKEDLMKVMVDFFNCGIINAITNETFICLFAKKKEFIKVSDFRPISLVTSLYKMLSKVLASRLREVLGSTISSYQGAFVRGRQILDAALIANEVVEESRRLNKSGMVFKIDFEKAYDHVEWRFIDEVMIREGFGERWRRWIRGCLETANFSVMINGRPRGKFSASRGLRQGDPLSPFVFTLVIDVLCRIMEIAQNADPFHGLS